MVCGDPMTCAAELGPAHASSTNASRSVCCAIPSCNYRVNSAYACSPVRQLLGPCFTIYTETRVWRSKCDAECSALCAALSPSASLRLAPPRSAPLRSYCSHDRNGSGASNCAFVILVFRESTRHVRDSRDIPSTALRSKWALHDRHFGFDRALRVSGGECRWLTMQLRRG